MHTPTFPAPLANFSHGLKASLPLHTGYTLPIVGLGTYQLEDEQKTATIVKTALSLGYRHLDTASIYKNERGVGAGIRASGVDRAELFITTKVWNTEQGYKSTIAACEASLERLGLAYIDLYLIHWPKPQHTTETWRAMKELQQAGKIRSLGVSNFTEKHLEVLLADKIRPTVNQVELHPQFPQAPLKAFCAKHNIYLEAWAPLLRGKVFEMPPIRSLAEKYNKTPAQITLRWQIQQNIITIPKTANIDRMRENSAIFDFELTAADFKEIAALSGKRVWSHPDEIDF